MSRFSRWQSRYESPPDEKPGVECPCCDEEHWPEVERDYDEYGPCGASYEKFCPDCAHAECTETDEKCLCSGCRKKGYEESEVEGLCEPCACFREASHFWFTEKDPIPSCA
jgi:hypothetical protein